jgi:hypothetical protein
MNNNVKALGRVKANPEVEPTTMWVARFEEIYQHPHAVDTPYASRWKNRMAFPATIL